MRDVMVFTPVKRLAPETVKAIFELEWDGPLSILMQQDNPTGDPYADHLYQFQRGREMCLAGPYEAMLVIESDIVPPADALTRLAGLEADLAYGCYLFRAGRVVNIFNRYKPWPETSRNLGESLSLHGQWGTACRQGVIECSGAGLGCILIRRKVLENEPFEKPTYNGYFDYEWTQKVYGKGYRMMADTAVRCGHVDADGVILWPN